MNEGIKLTDFGEIPVSWDVKQINEVTTYVDYRGKTPPKVDSGILLITARNIKMGKIDYDVSQEYIPSELYETVMSRGIPKLGDVLITTEAPLGNVASIDKENIALAQRVIKYRGKNGVLDNSYLKYFMLGPIFQSMLDKKSSGSTVKGIKGSILHKLNLILPPLPEQQKIAEILSTVDAKIEVIDQQITETQTLKKGLMQRLLTKGIGHTEFKDSALGEIPKSWEVVKLEDIGEFFKGKGISKSEILQNGQFPCLRYGEIYTIYDTVIYKFQSFINQESANNSIVFKSGDLLFTGSGETAEDIGKCVTYIGNEQPYASGDLIIHRPKKGDSKFLSYCMNSSIIRNQTKKMGQGNAVVHIYTKHLSQLTFAFPPFEEQTQIAEILCSIDDKIEVLSEKKTHYQELKQGLMQQLLTGKIRVSLNEKIHN